MSNKLPYVGPNSVLRSEYLRQVAAEIKDEKPKTDEVSKNEDNGTSLVIQRRQMKRRMDQCRRV